MTTTPAEELAAATTTTSPLVGLVSGCAGAVALVYVGQPLDTVKVRMQLSTAVHATSAAYGGGGGGSLSMWSCVRDMWRQALRVAPPALSQPARRRLHDNATIAVVESSSTSCAPTADKMTAAVRMARLMYAGTAPALLANVAENGVLFAAYGPCQRLVSFVTGVFRGRGVDEADQKLCPLSMAAAGSLASLCSAFALCPTELIKVRLQAADLERSKPATAANKPLGTLQLVARVWRTEGGLRGMYRGLGSTVAREMPGYYVFFLAYEASRNYLNDRHRETAVSVMPVGGGTHLSSANPDEPAWVTMVAGAMAGTCLWLVVYPVDVIKSRIQATGGCGGQNVSGSFLKTLAASVRDEGPLSLYRGLAPTLLRTVPASAVMFLTVERVTTLLSGYGL